MKDQEHLHVVIRKLMETVLPPETPISAAWTPEFSEALRHLDEATFLAQRVSCKAPEEITDEDRTVAAARIIAVRILLHTFDALLVKVLGAVVGGDEESMNTAHVFTHSIASLLSTLPVKGGKDGAPG